MKMEGNLHVIFAFLLILVFSCGVSLISGFGNNDKVLLNDVKVLTLYNNRMTNARRSNPIPQLKCVGGTAAGRFVPQVVQCYNRGSDGYDIQWECKTDMDNAYRFGKVEVSCEGYNYPDDPYILKGSCGLEYTIDYTKEGYENQQSHDYYGNEQQSDGYTEKSYHQSPRKGTMGTIFSEVIMLCVCALIIYVIYTTCIRSERRPDQPPPYSAPNSAQPPPYNNSPPPYGFRQEYTNTSCGSDGYGSSNWSHSGAPNPGTGGFWTGAATGGILGYLFGSSGNRGYQRYNSPYRGWFGSNTNYGWGRSYSGNSQSSFFGRPSSSSSSSSSSFSSRGTSTGTRTASGFGGTKRR